MTSKLRICDWITSSDSEFSSHPWRRQWGWCGRCKRLQFPRGDEVETSVEDQFCGSSILKRKVAEDDVRGRSLWSSAPDDILCLISKKIKCIDDFVRFCAVCRPWYSFGTDYYFRRKRLQFGPLFMLKEDPNPSTAKRIFHNHVSGNKFVLDLPETFGRRCWGSSFGWIITFGAADLELSLLNPFSRASIALPSLRTLLPSAVNYNPRERFIKAILTASPESPDCLVVLVIKPSRFRPRSKVGFARPGIDHVWWCVEGCPHDINDVVWFKGGLYGSRRTSLELVLIQFQIQSPRCSIFAVLPPDLEQGGTSKFDIFVDDDMFESRKYVADIGGELCLVLRYVTGGKTFHFKTFKIDINTKKWSRIWPFSEDECLFVGNHNTFTETCSPSGYFRANVVYYTHDDDLSVIEEVDEGVYDSYKSVFERTREDSTSRPSLWITPCLHFSRLDQPEEEMHGPPKKLRTAITT